MRSINDIGTALYELKRHIIALQEAHYKAETQEPNELEEETEVFLSIIGKFFIVYL